MEQQTQAKYKAYYFHASWCEPCKEFGPVLERVSKEFPEVEIVKLDMDTMEGVSEGLKWGVRSIPTLAAEGMHEIYGKNHENVIRTWLSAVPNQARAVNEIREAIREGNEHV